jgi:ABC transporter DrrB family efflux protein
MSVATLPAPPLGQRLVWAVGDALTLTKRNLLVWIRVPAYLVFTVVQPVMFVLLFRYVFGGAIHTRNAGGYVNFLMPGVVGQTAAFASVATAIALATELQKGVIDRLRSMPMARSAVLVGRLMADTIRMLITIVVIVAVGYGVGFRFQDGVAAAVGMVLLALLFGLTVCCISAFVGLAIKDEESVQAFGLIWLFPLTFVSSAFVPITSMPGWLQAFANNQPITIVIDTLRRLALGPVASRQLGLGTSLEPHLWQSLVWMAGLLAVFGPLAVRAYRRAS